MPNGNNDNKAVFKKIQKLSSSYRKTNFSKIYIFLIQWEIICESLLVKHYYDIVNLECYSRPIQKIIFKLQTKYNICACTSTACKTFHVNTRLQDL